MTRILLYLITVIILVYVGIYDYKHRIISDKVNILLTGLGIVNVIYDFKNVLVYLISTALVFSFFLISAMVTDGGIGGGDIKLLSALALIFGKDILLVIMFTYTAATLMLIPGLIFKRFRFNSNVALGPFIALGTILQVVNSF